MHTCMYVIDMVKVISISDRAYELLSRLKNGNSFTKVIEELAESKANVGDVSTIEPFFGVLKDKKREKEWLAEIKASRRAFKPRYG
ncbi:MAG: antitoxin VapB family protein [Candidatus Micrarchaeaceae archaeon]